MSIVALCAIFRMPESESAREDRKLLIPAQALLRAGYAVITRDKAHRRIFARKASEISATTTVVSEATTADLLSVWLSLK
jgi:hypothetical protein